MKTFKQLKPGDSIYVFYKHGCVIYRYIIVNIYLGKDCVFTCYNNNDLRKRKIDLYLSIRDIDKSSIPDWRLYTNLTDICNQIIDSVINEE